MKEPLEGIFVLLVAIALLVLGLVAAIAVVITSPFIALLIIAFLAYALVEYVKDKNKK